MKRTVPPDPLRVALQIVVGGLCTLNHHERIFAISDLNDRIGVKPTVEQVQWKFDGP